MLCENCKKRPATVHIKEFHNGECKSTHLCAECAGKQEEQGELGNLGFKLSELLFNAGIPEKKNDKEETPEKTPAADGSDCCPVCSWTVAKIRKNNGKVGCPECYKTFAPLLADAFSQIQRGTMHLGKHPASPQGGDRSGELKLELKKLQTELADLVSREEYESAAVCRDRINAIRKKLENIQE